MNKNSTSAKTVDCLQEAIVTEVALSEQKEQLEQLIVDYEAKVIEFSENKETALRRLGYLHQELEHLKWRLRWIGVDD
jgi:hypothetical protein